VDQDLEIIVEAKHLRLVRLGGWEFAEPLTSKSMPGFM